MSQKDQMPRKTVPETFSTIGIFATPWNLSPRRLRITPIMITTPPIHCPVEGNSPRSNHAKATPATGVNAAASAISAAETKLIPRNQDSCPATTMSEPYTRVHAQRYGEKISVKCPGPKYQRTIAAKRKMPRKFLIIPKSIGDIRFITLRLNCVASTAANVPRIAINSPWPKANLCSLPYQAVRKTPPKAIIPPRTAIHPERSP